MIRQAGARSISGTRARAVATRKDAVSIMGFYFHSGSLTR